MKTEPKLLIALLPYLFGGVSRRSWERRAASGQLGPVTAEPGMTRSRYVLRAEIERRFSPITADQYEQAVRHYEADRCAVRRIAS